MAEIAVIIPAHIPTAAHITWLGEAVGSVREQTFQDWELAVVFDGRTDLDLDRMDGKIKLLAFDVQQGPAYARNAGVRVTSAPWIVFLDADDKLKPDALEKLYAARHQGAAVYGDLDWIGERQGHERLVDFDPRYLREFSGPQPITALHHRLAWQAVNGLTEHLEGLEDLEYWIKLYEIGVYGFRVDATTLEYRQHGDSRQKQLETTGRIHAVTKEIRERHATFFSGGGQTMACNNCPGRVPGQNPATPPQPAGTVAVRYAGLREGSFDLPPSPLSGERFHVDGKGAFLYVHPAEVEHLLLYNERGGPMFQVVNAMPTPEPVTVQAVPVIAAPKLFENLSLQPEVEDITGLSVKQAKPVIAKQTSIPDLRIMAAMERSAQNRDTIQKLIGERMKELSGE